MAPRWPFWVQPLRRARYPRLFEEARVGLRGRPRCNSSEAARCISGEVLHTAWSDSRAARSTASGVRSGCQSTHDGDSEMRICRWRGQSAARRIPCGVRFIPKRSHFGSSYFASRAISQIPNAFPARRFLCGKAQQSFGLSWQQQKGGLQQ